MKNSVKCHFKPDVDNIKEIATGNGGQRLRRRGQTEQRSQRRSKVLVKEPKAGRQVRCASGKLASSGTTHLPCGKTPEEGKQGTMGSD